MPTETDVITEVPVEPASLGGLHHLCGDAFDAFEDSLTSAARRLNGRRVWHVNSTAEGGGVAEMLHAFLPYLAEAGWDVRWAVMSGDEDFFDITKGMHHALHGSPPADNAIWDDFERVYRTTTSRNAADLVPRVEPGDIAIIHDPQAAGLIGPLTDAGVHVSWQCHIGTEDSNGCTQRAWDALRPFVAPADRYVFTRTAYLWDGLDADKLRIIPPAIDALAPKNAEIDDARIATTLAHYGIDPEATIVLQVSRWDRLKDPIGFIRMFTDHLSDIDGVHAIYAGPATAAVDDDPEGAAVFAACEELWRSLRPDVQDRMHLLSIPMDDIDENARVINALQRRADVVVQKSFKEGFGLTVAEAMWKRRPVVASRVGGIQDQIDDHRTGRLIDDPYDIAAFGTAVRDLIADPEAAHAMGDAAHAAVYENYLAPRMLRQYAELVCELA